MEDELKKSLLLLLVFLGLVFFVVGNIEVDKLVQVPSEIYSNYEEINRANKDKLFGTLVKLVVEEEDLSTDNNKSSAKAIFKLFGFIPVKKVKINYIPEEEVYIGGRPIGLSVNSLGAIVISDNSIDLSSNQVYKNQVLKNGDIITKVNHQEFEHLNEITNLIDQNQDNAEIEFIRDGKSRNCTVPLIKDSSGRVKLGIWVKDDISGIGTLTFVRKSDNAFGALGHPVTNGKSDSVVAIKGGNIYDCTLVSITKGEHNDPGELRCVFVPQNSIGTITQNTNYGIYGQVNNLDMVDTNITYPLGGRLSARCGDAKIVSYINGIKEEYDIEIIKTSYQNKSSDKSMVFRVKDKKLLDLTGGIVQGMSGSPIIQNGKIIGAVTHVFISDPTKGYAIYTDWMLEQLNNQQ